MTFLDEPPPSAAAEAAFAQDREEDGYVMNATRLWSWRPDLYTSFAALRASVMETAALTERDLAVLVTATAAESNDSYCSLAWAPRLAELSDDSTAAQVIAGSPAPALTDREEALAVWARRVVQDPNGTTERDIERLRAAGLGDLEIFESTVWIAFRIAFSTVNDALGAAPDRQLADAAPAPIRAAVSYGRPPAAEPSAP